MPLSRKNCVVRESTTGLWDDRLCDESHGYVCEAEGAAIRAVDRHAYVLLQGLRTWAASSTECRPAKLPCQRQNGVE